MTRYLCWEKSIEID